MPMPKSVENNTRITIFALYKNGDSSLDAVRPNKYNTPPREVARREEKACDG